MNDDFYLERARLQLAGGGLEGALCALRDGVRDANTTDILKLALAKLCVHCGHLDESIELLNEILFSGSPVCEEAALGLAVIAGRKNDSFLEDCAFRRLYFLNPKAPELLEWLFPEPFKTRFDSQVAALLSGTIGMYLFDRDELSNPHKRLLRDFSSFIRIGVSDKHKNFLEIGTGCGSISYIACRLGLDVVSTDIGVTDTIYEGQSLAGTLSRSILGVETRTFLLSPLTSIAELMTFQNATYSDVIYMKGVQFNRSHSAWNGRTFPSSEGHDWFATSNWFQLQEWKKVLEDLMKYCNPGGLIMMLSLFGVDEILGQNIVEYIVNHERRPLVSFHYNPHPLFGVLVDLSIRLDSQERGGS